MDNDKTGKYECVEPALGDLLWQYDAPKTDPDLRQQLDNHLSVCAACRLEHAVQEKMVASLESGRLQVGEPRDHQRAEGALARLSLAAKPLAWTATLAMAACLVLIFVLPPRPGEGERIVRGDGDVPRFLRPVAGEVVLDRHPRLSWTPIPHATRYRLTLLQAGGDFEWSGETDGTDLLVPESAALPLAARMRAILEPIPAHLAPAAGISVSFNTGALDAFVAYRLRAAPPAVKLLGWLGIALVIGAGGLGLARRRMA